MQNRHVSNTAPCLLCSCASQHDLHISTSRHHVQHALLLQWRLIYAIVIHMPHAFYAVARVRTTFISHICTSRPHLSNMASYYNGGSFTMRNRHVSNTAPCLLCSCACPHDLHIIHMSTSRHHLSNMALLLQWRLIYYAKSPCVQYSPMPFMQLRVSARPPYHTYEYI